MRTRNNKNSRSNVGWMLRLRKSNATGLVADPMMTSPMRACAPEPMAMNLEWAEGIVAAPRRGRELEATIRMTASEPFSCLPLCQVSRGRTSPASCRTRCPFPRNARRYTGQHTQKSGLIKQDDGNGSRLGRAFGSDQGTATKCRAMFEDLYLHNDRAQSPTRRVISLRLRAGPANRRPLLARRHRDRLVSEWHCAPQRRQDGPPGSSDFRHYGRVLALERFSK
jgi:hypothetical protein